jgi:hypothetical protein
MPFAKYFALRSEYVVWRRMMQTDAVYAFLNGTQFSGD